MMVPIQYKGYSSMFLLNLCLVDFIPNINTERIDCGSHVMHILGYAICKKKESEATEEKDTKMRVRVLEICIHAESASFIRTLLVFMLAVKQYQSAVLCP